MKLELSHIEKLMEAMERHKMESLELEADTYKLKLETKKEYTAAPALLHREMPHHECHKVKNHDIPTSLHPPHDHETPAKEEKKGEYITSPMVGTFYLASGPDEPAFVKVGDTVSEESVVCIIEAMKVMNEIKSGKKGAIVELLVENGHPVEFGTKLFKIS